MSKRIAIIGSGISGLTCAYLLHKDNHISVFEANDYVGGHTATKQIDLDGKAYAIDTGFIVFNDWTYPNFIKLLNQLGVEKQATEMSFSVKNSAENLEYNGNTINSLFAQRRNILRPSFLRLVRDILKFNKACKRLAATNDDTDDKTLIEFINELGLSSTFVYNYILPMCAAIWSSSVEDTKGFPLRFFLQFFNNHGLLNVTDRPQWYSIVGGSHQYIKPLTKGFEDNIRLNTPIKAVRKLKQGVEITPIDGEAELYDEVIFACHSDQALSMLEQPSAAQMDILSAIPYAMNEVVLHTDTQILPQRRLAWASWNYKLTGSANEQSKPASVTYNMNLAKN
jgi:predicted NAD/FAD-binding protein